MLGAKTQASDITRFAFIWIDLKPKY